MSYLFSHLKLREIEMKNRIMVSPMCEYSSEDGFANDWHLVHLGARAIGGAAVVMTEATAVSPEGRITDEDLGIWKDEHIESLKRITSFISDHGAVPGMQLAHAGRKASRSAPWKGDRLLSPSEGGWEILAPSALRYSEAMGIPKAMDLQDIAKVRTDFRSAAGRAREAGFQILEIHAAHGYLLNEFLSPLTNKRGDEYGGSFENRIRLLLEIVTGIRQVWPENYLLFVRISAIDWYEGGWTLDDSIALAIRLKALGVDLIDCSSGGIVHEQKITPGPGYQVPFAERIRKEAGIPTGAVGLITTAEQAETILKEGSADMIVLARQLLRDPYFPLHAATALGEDIEWPVQYLRAKKKS